MDIVREYFAPITNLVWKFKHRYVPRHKYNTIYTDLPPGYYDIDTLMLHGNMKLLTRYVENEMGGLKTLEEYIAELKSPGAIDPNVPVDFADYAKSYEEARDIYIWWTVTRPADQLLASYLLEKLYGKGRVTFADDGEIKFKPFEGDEILMEKQLHDLEDKMGKDEDEMLKRLIDIRHSLWT